MNKPTKPSLAAQAKALVNTGLTQADVEMETERAIMVHVPIIAKRWLPKSQVTWLDNQIHVPGWLAKRVQEQQDDD